MVDAQRQAWLVCRFATVTPALPSMSLLNSASHPPHKIRDMQFSCYCTACPGCKRKHTRPTGNCRVPGAGSDVEMLVPSILYELGRRGSIKVHYNLSTSKLCDWIRLPQAIPLIAGRAKRLTVTVPLIEPHRPLYRLGKLEKFRLLGYLAGEASFLHLGR